MDLLLSEVQSSLVVRPTRVHDNSVDGSLVGEDLGNGGVDGGLLGHIRLDGLELPGVFLLGGMELVARLGVVDGVDDGGAVVKAGFGDT